jgi:hypothetical protein
MLRMNRKRSNHQSLRRRSLCTKKNSPQFSKKKSRNQWLRRRNVFLMSAKRRKTMKKTNTCHRRKISPWRSRAMRVTNKITTRKTTWLGLIMTIMATVVKPKLSLKKMNSLGS